MHYKYHRERSCSEQYPRGHEIEVCKGVDGAGAVFTVIRSTVGLKWALGGWQSEKKHLDLSHPSLGSLGN